MVGRHVGTRVTRAQARLDTDTHTRDGSPTKTISLSGPAQEKAHASLAASQGPEWTPGPSSAGLFALD